MSEAMVAEGLKLEVRRVVRADRARVFAAWTKPEMLKKWFGPETMFVPNAELDARVGGAYRIEVQRTGERKEGEHVSDTSVATGVYTEIVPDELLSFTWNGDWIRGEETLVTVRLKDVAGGTEVAITHERFASAESRDGHERGWTASLAKLAMLFDEQK